MSCFLLLTYGTAKAEKAQIDRFRNRRVFCARHRDFDSIAIGHRNRNRCAGAVYLRHVLEGTTSLCHDFCAVMINLCLVCAVVACCRAYQTAVHYDNAASADSYRSRITAAGACGAQVYYCRLLDLFRCSRCHIHGWVVTSNGLLRAIEQKPLPSRK